MVSGRDRRTLLFVCTANVCRSPMAEALFNALAEDARLPYEAASAGVAALVGEPIAPEAGAVLAEMGVHTNGHRARQADGTVLREADLVLGMTPRHVRALRSVPDGSPGRIHTLLGYVGDDPRQGIPDPYGLSITIYRASAQQLLRYVSLLVERLAEDGRTEP